MHRDPPKRQKDFAKYVEMWQDKMTKSEAHGDESKLAPVFEVNVLRMLMTRKVADGNATDVPKSC